MRSSSRNNHNGLGCSYGEKKLIKQRAKVNEMYFKQGLSKKSISRTTRMSMDFVIKWTKEEGQDPTVDNRGWPKGLRRNWDILTEKRIQDIYSELSNDPQEFFAGATAIKLRWDKLYEDKPPPLRTIGQILKDLGLSDKKKKGSTRGASRYLCYPEHTIYSLLGGKVLEADFIGKKYITGRSAPLHFVGFSFKKTPKLRYYKRIEADTADNFIKGCTEFFSKFEKPDFIKVDNALSMIGSASGKRNISKTMNFLLKNEVIPIFAVPRKPFSQASIEGNNSVFSRFFWNKIEFKNLKEIDTKLNWFNDSSKNYSGYTVPKTKENKKKSFTPKIYFIRQVRECENGEGLVSVLNESISVEPSYINYFVLAEWDLLKERLLIHFEREQAPKTIKEIDFEMNEHSKKGGRLSSCL